MDDVEKKELNPGMVANAPIEDDRVEDPDNISIAASSDETASSPDNDREDEPEKKISRAPSTASKSVRSVKSVPRLKRRGLFATLTLVPEVEDPTQYSNKVKWFLTFIVAFAGMAAPTGSSIILPALKEISIDLHTTTTVTNLSIAFYMLSMSIFPLWWSSFSETLGRRTIYITSFMLFTLWAVLSAVAKNIAMLIVMRVLSGGAAASVQAVGAGTIADMWEPKERGRAMGIFYLGPLCGPLFAPIIGGALAEGLGWRSTLWFLVIYGGLMLVLLIFTLPETLKKKNNVVAEATQEAVTETLGENGPADRTTPAAAKPEALQRISTRQSVQIKTKKGLSVLRRFFIDPLSIVLYLRYPAIAMVVYYASITFGSLYVLNISVQQTFSRAPYNFSTLIVGLLYIPNSLGYVLASIFGGRWIDYIMKREAKRAGRYDAKGKLMFRPEDRMRENAWLGALLFPGALIWYGWTADRGVFWFVPMLANFFFGVGSMLIFALATTMLTEFLPSRASSGIALNNFLRNICSFAGAVAAGPWIDAIGNGWVFTILGCVSLISGVVTIVTFRVKGEAWRAKMGEGGL